MMSRSLQNFKITENIFLFDERCSVPPEFISQIYDYYSVQTMM